MSIKSLEVDFKDNREGERGYANEMSPEWFECARKMLLREYVKTNSMITTALIPGKNIPLLITK